MEFEEYLRYKFFKYLPVYVTSFHGAVMADGKLACRRYAIGICHDNLIHVSVTHKQTIMDAAIRQLHNGLIKDNVLSINKQSFKITNNMVCRIYTIAIDAYIINNELAEGGIFYERNETYAQLIQ